MYVMRRNGTTQHGEAAPAPELEAKGGQEKFRGAPRYGERGSANL